MSNLEDVFLKINQEFAPDLFGDLKTADNSVDQSKEEYLKNIVSNARNSNELPNDNGMLNLSDSRKTEGAIKSTNIDDEVDLTEG